MKLLLCQFILLAAISAKVFGAPNYQIVNVTCKDSNHEEDWCYINYAHAQYMRISNPIKINIFSTDTSKNRVNRVRIDGNYEAMPLNLFQSFPNLVELRIETGLKQITKENLVDGNKIEILDLSSNEITAIKDHTFASMDKLEVIDLSDNKLTRIEFDAFSGAINLKKLVLRSNEIDSVEDGSFNILTLEDIDLSQNKIRTLADGVFVGCPNLETLSLSVNALTRVGKSIVNVPKLRALYLGIGANITDFDFHAIARMPHLVDFHAVDVGLVLTDPASLADDISYNVDELHINENNLSYPDILLRLKNFRNVKYLDLGYNLFTTISDIETILEMFPKLEKLNTYYLPCMNEVFQRLLTKFGDKVSRVMSSECITFHKADEK